MVNGDTMNLAPARAQKVTAGRLWLVATKTFGITALLASGLHVIPPIAFLLPLGTGFVAGWDTRATIRQATCIAAIMGLWLTGVVAVITLIVAAVAPSLVANIWSGGALVGVLIGGFLVLHLAVFAGVGAAIGGHRARAEAAKEQSTA